MKLISIVGPHGVGKTTGLEHLYRNLREARVDGVGLSVMSRVLFEIADEAFGVHFKMMDEAQRQVVRRMAVERIVGFGYEVTLVDQHYVEMAEGRVQEIVAPDIKPLIDLHVVMIAEPAVIVDRRRMDHRRNGLEIGDSRILDLDVIRRELDAELERAYQMASVTGTTVEVVDTTKSPDSHSAAVRLQRAIRKGGINLASFKRTSEEGLVF